MNRELLTLIAITDDLHDGIDGLVDRASEVARGGATMVELRLKYSDPRMLVDVGRALVAALSIPVIVNDRADIALAAGAAGVHLGPDDVPVRAVRSIAPPTFIIGASVRHEDEIENASAADYVAIGSVYGTRSKRDAGIPIGLGDFARLAQLAGRPAVGVGGITAETAAAVMDAGAVGVAALSALFGAEHPDRAALAIRSAIGR
jgi:thiamine-phosphate pyrophosphorylase